MVQVGAAAVPEHVAGVARVLQVAGLQSFIHYGQRMPLFGNAPADEEINLIAVVPHSISGWISLGNDSGNEFPIIR